MSDSWVKEPEKVSIPDVDQEAIEKAIRPLELRYYKLVQDVKTGKVTDEAVIDAFVDELYKLRGEGLQDGEYAEGNLVFKEMRNKGYLDSLKDLPDKVIADRLSLEEALYLASWGL